MNGVYLYIIDKIMKKILVVLALCFGHMVLAQEIIREKVDGKIVVEGSDLQGITIYNTVSKVGTSTNERGEFQIEVALNDLIEVREL